ncbi:dethiobiotin synthase [Cardinium endosymbiont of Sogatella furcifera]|uniref:dethiobiotin synthase n=1 Tax=Cardinium endosymbiont of Sogatella furcifera TaxID=650378 RepID=UPI000E0D435B|nr:dethiobiotin synthase [Cardinium endosymbiont of Sogatella furcifera]AXI24639.1 dethiobiotin synthase [Cardinium endosymbiont of Sogatella furcifera]
MKIFVTGTDTDVGKTIISSWLCLHTGYHYFKPIQTGSTLGTDSHEVNKLTGTNVYKEDFLFEKESSPHLAASIECRKIDIEEITLPKVSNLIIEGAGGILVPINETIFMVDLIKKCATPVILVARSTIGTINHTLLSLEALRARNISILGIILNGQYNKDNLKAIEFYGKVKVLASIPTLQHISKENLIKVPFLVELQTIFNII